MKYFMMIFLALTTVFTLIHARENPFSPVNSKDNVGKATQIKDTRKNFNQARIQLPSSARILKKLELHYQNLDGSIMSKSITIDEKIDWHDVLVLQKANDQATGQVMAISQPVPMPKPSPKKEKVSKRDFMNILDFSVEGDKITINTKDKKIRDFLITDPYKIVIDFKREIDFYTKSYNLKNQKVSTVTFGKHDGYYRMVLELDGQYRYKIQKSSKGHFIRLY